MWAKVFIHSLDIKKKEKKKKFTSKFRKVRTRVERKQLLSSWWPKQWRCSQECQWTSVPKVNNNIYPRPRNTLPEMPTVCHPICCKVLKRHLCSAATASPRTVLSIPIEKLVIFNELTPRSSLSEYQTIFFFLNFSLSLSFFS